jgi:pimeloyl-ACP methyl ester carboxylesterase
VRALLGRLGVKKVKLVCHSLGGQVCAALSIENPGLVDSLTLIDSAGTYDSRFYAQATLRRVARFN